MNEAMKTCPVCGVSGPLGEFRQYNCKLCARATDRAYYRKKRQDPAYVMAQRKRDRDRRKLRYHEDPVWREAQKVLKDTRQRGRLRRHVVVQGRVRKAIKTGELVPDEHCSRCGHDFSEHRRHAHHADYSKPLEVEWLCQPCHCEEHRKLAPATLPPSR